MDVSEEHVDDYDLDGWYHNIIDERDRWQTPVVTFDHDSRFPELGDPIEIEPPYVDPNAPKKVVSFVRSTTNKLLY